MSSPNSKQDTRIVISHYDTITTRCTQILTGTWNLICSGGYPLDALIRYDGRLVAAGDRYAVFRSQVEPDSLLAVFRSRAVALCKILRIQSMHEFECVDRRGGQQIITIGHSHLVCVQYAFHLVDELVEHCSSARVPPNRFSALYYADIEVVLNQLRSGCGPALSSNILLLVVSAILLFVFVLHWR